MTNKKMFLVLTDFHYFVYKKYFFDFKIIDFRRKPGNGFFKKLYILICLIFVSKKYVMIPHIFNLWGALLSRLCWKFSFYDDGIAYYNNTITPKRFVVYVYYFLSDIKKNLSSFRSIGKVGYLEFISFFEYFGYYSFYPEALPFVVDRIKKIPLKVEGKCYFKNKNKKNVLFLDTSEQVISKYKVKDILHEINTIKKCYDNVSFYYKAHPSGKTLLTKELSKIDDFEELKGSFEEFVFYNKVISIYSIYSSASLSAKIIDKDINIYFFKNKLNNSMFSKLQPLCKELDAIEIEI